jgi:hypothetical protein
MSTAPPASAAEDHCVGAGVGSEIAQRNLGAASRGPNRVSHRFRPVFVAPVDDNCNTFRGEQFGDRLTQSGARSSHQCALSG